MYKNGGFFMISCSDKEKYEDEKKRKKYRSGKGKKKIKIRKMNTIPSQLLYPHIFGVQNYKHFAMRFSISNISIFVQTKISM